MKCIAVTNEKGGVAKTTTAVNLGAALAEMGHRVLLIDMDAQANLTLAVGQIHSKSTPQFWILFWITSSQLKKS